jgi:hypothetical protein
MAVTITSAELQFGVANVNAALPERCIIPNYTYRRKSREVSLSVASGSTGTISMDNYQISTIQQNILVGY